MDGAAESEPDEDDEDDEEPTQQVDFNVTVPAREREPDAVAAEWRVAPLRSGETSISPP